MLGVMLAITTVLVIISVYDYKTKEIPNGFNLAFFVLSLIYLILACLGPQFNWQTLMYHLASGVFGFAFFYSFVFFSHETWMGGGDAKMALGMGLLLGPLNTFLAVTVASVVGSVYGISQLIIHRDQVDSNGNDVKNKARHEVPFGPFLALGTYVTMVFGPQIIDWYVRIFLGL